MSISFQSLVRLLHGSEVQAAHMQLMGRGRALARMKDDESLSEPLLVPGQEGGPCGNSSKEKHTGVFGRVRGAWASCCQVSAAPTWVRGLAPLTWQCSVRKSKPSDGVWLLFCILLIIMLALLDQAWFSSSLYRHQSTMVMGRCGQTTPCRHPEPPHPQELSVGSLLRARSQAQRPGAYRDCLDVALREFRREPAVVQSNARLMLDCNGTAQAFQSGKGQAQIQVAWIAGKAKYNIQVNSTEAYVSRLKLRQFPLNLTSLLSVQQDLTFRRAPELVGQCLERAVQEVSRVLECLLWDAQLVVTCGGAELTFVSGEGHRKMNVYADGNGTVQYWEQPVGWLVRFAQLLNVNWC
ncbi:uncharacterized protein LOC132244095 [Alligator mississippiensis]|nr:uncharacterized protein LOC132244095 [Alligator mississippiensis]